MADTEPMGAEAYLRSKYGAYRGHPEWRALETAFNAGRATLPSPRNSHEEELRVAAGDVLKRWDSPLWREESTAELMGQLRAALASRPAEVDDECKAPIVDGACTVCGWGPCAEQHPQNQRDAVAADRARREKGGD